MLRRSLRELAEAPGRLRWYVLSTLAAGVPIVVAAAFAASRTDPGGRTALGVAMFFCFMLLAEWRPVPIDPEGRRLVSLAFVFIISSRLLFGWEWSVLTGSLAIGLAMAGSRSDPIKALFNSATYALAAGAAALPLLVTGPIGRTAYGTLACAVVAGGAVFMVANVALVCLAIGLAGGGRFLGIFRDHLRHSGPIFAVMVFVAAQAVIFWRLSAPLMLLLSAPLFALTLYQRSSVRHRAAVAAASTDSLTGLKNRRAFEEDAAQALASAGSGRRAVALCLIDVDRFKQVNDQHGHQVGDAALQLLARAIESSSPGRGYRLGGDEFAMLLEGSSEAAETAVAGLRSAFVEAQRELTPATPVTLSAGIAEYPGHAHDLSSLKQRADMALYQSKYNGRDCATVYAEKRHGDRRSAGDLFKLQFPLVDIRLLTARRLAALVDAFSDASAAARGHLAPTVYTDVLDRWRGFDGKHSQSVASLSVALASRLGVEGEELEHIHLAGLLHDVGKIAVPEQILNKPSPLTDVERDLVERHPVIGYELLRDLAFSPVDAFVLHHHERWDGGGYPHGLAETQIPFGSRIILVADAFDVLTSNRSYQSRVSVESAMDVLDAEAGRQFDPRVVAALHEHLAELQPEPVTPSASKEPAWSSSM